MKIKEIIVVEGKSDTIAIQNAVSADTIETNGSALNEETIEKIKLADKIRGVIIFTDPDFPGRKIRQQIIEHVPNCKHAFLSKEEASLLHKRGLGVEHASPEAIRKALSHARIMKTSTAEQISVDDLITANLIGGPQSRQLREQLGKILKIGYTNGKQLHKRLMMFEISKEQFADALKLIKEEHQDD